MGGGGLLLTPLPLDPLVDKSATSRGAGLMPGRVQAGLVPNHHPYQAKEAGSGTNNSWDLRKPRVRFEFDSSLGSLQELPVVNGAW